MTQVALASLSATTAPETREQPRCHCENLTQQRRRWDLLWRWWWWSRRTVISHYVRIELPPPLLPRVRLQLIQPNNKQQITMLAAKSGVPLWARWRSAGTAPLSIASKYHLGPRPGPTLRICRAPSSPLLFMDTWRR